MMYDQCAHRREAWLLRQVPTLSRCDGALLRRLLAGEEFPDIAEAEGIQHRTIDMRSRHVLKTLKTRLRETPLSPARAEPHS
jgi:hypothetical protein